MAKLRVVVHYLSHQLLEHLLANDAILLARYFSDGLGDRVDDFVCFSAIDFVTHAAAAILVSESGATRVKRKKRRNGFRQSAADWETAAACVKMETESSVLIRPLIATPAQGVSRS